MLLELLATDCPVFESADAVVRSVLRYRQGGPGFSDLMILAASGRAEALPLHTFDGRLARVEGTALVAPDSLGRSQIGLLDRDHLDPTGFNT